MPKRESKRKLNKSRPEREISIETRLHMIDSFCMRPTGAKVSKETCEQCMLWDKTKCSVPSDEMQIVEEYRKRREQAFGESVKRIFRD